jgi:hypothetical protein
LSGFCESAFSLKICDVSFKETEFAFHFNRLLVNLNTRTTNPFFKWMPFLKSEVEIRESANFLNQLAYAAIKVSSITFPIAI